MVQSLFVHVAITDALVQREPKPVIEAFWSQRQWWPEKTSLVLDGHTTGLLSWTRHGFSPISSYFPVPGNRNVFWDQTFHCNSHSGHHGPLTLSQALLILSMIFLLVSTIGLLYDRLCHQEADKVPWPRVERMGLVCSVFGGCFAYVCGRFSDAMVIIGFAYCGHRTFLAIAACIMVVGQVFAAVEYAHQGKAPNDKTRRFLAGIFQARVFIDACESWKQQRVTDSFARQKFVDAIGESGSLAIFAVYVIFYLDLRYHPWLILSVLKSVISLACGIVVWLEFSFSHQLSEEHMEQEKFTIRWRHRCMWLCYLSSDFALRLLTLGLFLSSHKLRSYNVVAVAAVLVSYLLAIALQLRNYEREGKETEAWQVGNDLWIHVKRKVVAQRVVDALMLTWLVHVLPADLRLAPRHAAESRQLFALHPKLRTKIMHVLIPIRAADFLLLGGAAMYVHFDAWQCISLLGMFLATHVMLGQVLMLRGPRVARSPTLVGLPNEVVSAILKDSEGNAGDACQH